MTNYKRRLTMDNIEKLEKILNNVSTDDTAEYMAEILMDDSVSTYRMFEALANEYIKANEDERKGMDYAVKTLTSLEMSNIADAILSRYGG
jgi:hypothetical protein